MLHLRERNDTSTHDDEMLLRYKAGIRRLPRRSLRLVAFQREDTMIVFSVRKPLQIVTSMMLGACLDIAGCGKDGISMSSVPVGYIRL